MRLPTFLLLAISAYAFPAPADLYTEFTVTCSSPSSPSSSSPSTLSHAYVENTGCINLPTTYDTCQVTRYRWNWPPECRMSVFSQRDCGWPSSTVELWAPKGFEQNVGPKMGIEAGEDDEWEKGVRSYSVHCPHTLRAEGEALVVQQSE